ncbi:hypothetical protein [Streptomyces sp. ms115]|uniref:hypothetical protein n=1 Tax=Streptomyces sp. ms115 TaxID=1827928 RepID=UPI0011807CD0|nr:hypothetical protein [Streptomyces sp. ms115]
MKQIDFAVTDLSLDRQNPRHDVSTPTTREAIAALLEADPEKWVNLAQDIAAVGLNPTELTIVVEEEGDMVVIEGNRRVSALKALLEPDLVDHPGIRQQIGIIARRHRSTIPRTVRCVVSPSREAARHWIVLRHTGENQGVGVVRWNHEQVTRYAKKKNPSERALRFIHQVAAWYADDRDLLENVEKVRTSRLTTLARVLSDPKIRHSLGIEFTQDGILADYTPEAMHGSIRKIFSDLASHLSVSLIKSKEQRREYIGTLQDHLPQNSDRLAQPRLVKSTEEKKPALQTSATPSASAQEIQPKNPATKRPSEDKRVFQNVILRNVSSRTSKVLNEAKKVTIAESPNVAAIMIRAVIDITVSEAAERQGWRRRQDKLRDRIRVALSHIDPENQDRDLDEARRMSQNDGALSVKNLHAFMHQWAVEPMIIDVTRLSSVYTPMLVKIDAYLGENHK